MPKDPPWSSDWEPTEGILDWFRTMIRVATDGATWACPGNQSIYTIHKEKKEVHFMLGDDADDHNNWHQKNVLTFAKLGYTMLDKRS